MSFDISSAPALAAHGVRYATEIAAAAGRHRIDPTLLAAVAAQETGGPGSNGGRNILGDGGHGHGLFQIDDRWHAFARSSSAMDPAQNAEYAAGMLERLLDRYGGDVHKALSAYNAGSPTAVGTTTRWDDGSVLGYADSVLRHAAALDDARANTAATMHGVNVLASLAALAAPSPFTSPEITPPEIAKPKVDAPAPVRDKQTDYSSLLVGDEQ